MRLSYGEDKRRDPCCVVVGGVLPLLSPPRAFAEWTFLGLLVSTHEFCEQRSVPISPVQLLKLTPTRAPRSGLWGVVLGRWACGAPPRVAHSGRLALAESGLWVFAVEQTVGDRQVLVWNCVPASGQRIVQLRPRVDWAAAASWKTSLLELCSTSIALFVFVPKHTNIKLCY